MYNVILFKYPRQKSAGKDVKGDIFQSYDSVIAFDGDITLLDKTYWDYSRTTGKYRNQFLEMNTAQTQAKIDNGEIKLVNLN